MPSPEGTKIRGESFAKALASSQKDLSGSSFQERFDQLVQQAPVTQESSKGILIKYFINDTLEDSLPEGWEQRTNDTGITFFYNLNSGNSTYVDPRISTKKNDSLHLPSLPFSKLRPQSALYKEEVDKVLEHANQIASQYGLNLRYRRTFWLRVMEARNLIALDDETQSSNPYCCIDLGDVSIQTNVQNRTLSPLWSYDNKL